MSIKNIVFDVGNVLVQWNPEPVVNKIFPQESSPQELTNKIFKSPIWQNLNLGTLTELEAVKLYSKELSIPEYQLSKLMNGIKDSLTPVPGSHELLNELYVLGFSLYSITDNIREIVSYLKKRYNFFDKFSGVIVSAELGVVKPDSMMYQRLMDLYSLIPEETVFIDDLLINVNGAIKMGWHGIQFTSAVECRKALQDLGIILNT